MKTILDRKSSYYAILRGRGSHGRPLSKTHCANKYTFIKEMSEDARRVARFLNLDLLPRGL